jgi:hypothetical protein
MRLTVILNADGNLAAAMKEVTGGKVGIAIRARAQQTAHSIELPVAMEKSRLKDIVPKLRLNGVGTPTFKAD